MWQKAAREGVPLPAETLLASQLGVSRSTISEELLRLEGEGLPLRSARSGTFPSRAALGLGVRLNQSFEFAHMLRESGLTPTTELLESGWIKLAPEDARLVDLPPGSSAFRTVKRWLAGETPATLAIDIVPARLHSLEPDPQRSVFEIVEILRGQRSDWEVAKLRARRARPDEAEVLALPSRDRAILDLEMVGVSRQGANRYLSREVHRQGQVEYSVIRRVRHRDE